MAPAISAPGMEYSQDLTVWDPLVPAFPADLPPPLPPITLLDALKPVAGGNLLVVPVVVADTSHGFYRGVQRPAPTTPGASENSGNTSETVRVKPVKSSP